MQTFLYTFPLKNHSIGLDGCKGGWLAVSMTSLQNIRITLLEKISNIESLLDSHSTVWIDMPIGLSEGDYMRDLEAFARSYLKPLRSASIFTPPCRDAVYETDYQSAKLANLKQCGKSISIQSWNISPKIKELDSWLLAHESLQETIFEAHPEICFAALNKMRPLAESKHSSEGRDQRLQLLQQYLPSASERFAQALKDIPRKAAKADDILDAMCLALCAHLSKQHGMQIIEGNLKQDLRGLFIRMAYPIIP